MDAKKEIYLKIWFFLNLQDVGIQNFENERSFSPILNYQVAIITLSHQWTPNLILTKLY